MAPAALAIAVIVLGAGHTPSDDGTTRAVTPLTPVAEERLTGVAGSPVHQRLTGVAGSPVHQRLRRALLSERDMPPGYTLTERGDDAMGDVFRPNASCDNRPAEPDYEPLPPSVYAIFTKNRTGPTLIQAVGRTGNALARKMIASLAEIADHCPVWGNGPDPADGRTRMTRLPYPRLGDASIAVMTRTEGGQVAAEQTMIGMIAYRGVCVVFQHAETSRIDVAGMGSVMRASARKLQRTQ